jgi:hypothetical protein
MVPVGCISMGVADYTERPYPCGPHSKLLMGAMCSPGKIQLVKEKGGALGMAEAPAERESQEGRRGTICV